MDYLLDLGTIAGIILFIGYILYIWFDIKYDNIEPNPTTWFMFAYGTAILTVLEWDGEASWELLVLPTLCSIGGIVVALRLWLKARKSDPTRWWPEDWWPEDRWEQGSFVGDILITVAYVAIWVFAVYSPLLTETGREYWVLVFLFLSNVSTFPQFYPILSTTYKNPETEHWLPWAVWTVSYVLLTVATWQVVDAWFWHALLFYPISNAFLHAMVAVLALRKHPA